MLLYLLVALGGALGSVARFGLGRWIGAQCGDAFPWGTLLINVTGSFAIGFIASLAAGDGRTAPSESTRQFFMTGVLGGYTTFSAFSLQTLQLAQDGAWLRAGGYVAASVGLCLVAVWVGYALGRAVR